MKPKIEIIKMKKTTLGPDSINRIMQGKWSVIYISNPRASKVL